LDCFVRHAWFALSVSFVTENSCMAFGILSLSDCSWTIGLQIVLFGTHGLHCLFTLKMKIPCLRHLEFWACPNSLHQLKLDCFVCTPGLHCLFSFVKENSLLRHLEFLRLSNCSLTIRLQIVLLAQMVRTACFLSYLKILAQGIWNFELVQLFLDNWIEGWFVRHTWFVLPVFF